MERKFNFSENTSIFLCRILFGFIVIIIMISFNLNCKYVKPFHATGLFRYPLKTSESLWFSDAFRGYRKRPVARNGLRDTLAL